MCLLCVPEKESSATDQTDHIANVPGMDIVVVAYILAMKTSVFRHVSLIQVITFGPGFDHLFTFGRNRHINCGRVFSGSAEALLAH